MDSTQTDPVARAAAGERRPGLRLGLGRAMGLRYRWLIWFTITLLAFNQNLQMFAYPVLVPSVLAELHLSYVLAGGLMSAYTLSMTAVMVPVGMLADRLGSRWVVIGGLILLSLGTGLFALANSYPLAIASRVLVGAGAGVGIILPAPVLARWFSKAEFRSVLGLHVSMGKTGSILATWVLPPLLMALGWRLGYGVVSLVGPLALLVAAALMVSEPTDIALPADKQFAVPGPARPRPRPAAGAGTLRQLATNRNLLLAALAQFFMFGAYYGGLNWLPTYFKVVVGLSEVDAGFQTGFILWGTIVGFALSGPAANLLGRCLPIYRTGAAATAGLTLLFATALLPTLPAWTWPPLMLLYGISLSVMVLFMSILAAIVPAHALGTATGFGFTLAYTGAIVTPALIGAVADYSGSLTLALWVPAASAAACAALSLLVKEGPGAGAKTSCVVLSGL